MTLPGEIINFIKSKKLPVLCADGNTKRTFPISELLKDPDFVQQIKNNFQNENKSLLNQTLQNIDESQTTISCDKGHHLLGRGGRKKSRKKSRKKKKRKKHKSKTKRRKSKRRKSKRRRNKHVSRKRR